MEENRKQLMGRRLRLSNDDRRRLVAKAKLLGRDVLDEVAGLVTRDTLLRRDRFLITEKCDMVAFSTAPVQ